MDPLIFQKQIRDNNADLMNFCSDLKQWGEEMKRKDASLRSGNDFEKEVSKKIKKIPDSSTSKSSNAKKKNKKAIKSSDYAAWEKFDVEAECAKLDDVKDNDDSGELTDEIDEDIQEEAIYQKERGNAFVKNQKWDEAITCYTKAIEYYAYDPIFYANRALCYLKKQNYAAAESDCTTSLQLDKTYVKAYQRRAAAREALNQLTNARDDILKVFDYEPNNRESKFFLAKLEKKLRGINKEINSEKPIVQRPKSKFTLSQQQNKKSSLIQKEKDNKTVILEIDNTNQSLELDKTVKQNEMSYWLSGNDVELVENIQKPPHLRSKKSLQRVTIMNTDSIDIKKTSEECKSIIEPWPKPGTDNKLIKCDDLKIVERKLENKESEKFIEKEEKIEKQEVNCNVKKDIKYNFSTPETYIQFNTDWKLFKNDFESKYLYLKQINPTKIPVIFKESLDCEIFSGIIHVLSEMFLEEGSLVYEFLLALTKVKRFSMLSMFMSEDDKKNIKKLFDCLRLDANIPVACIDNLINKYSF